MHPDDYERIDAALAAGELDWSRDFAIDYAAVAQWHPKVGEMETVKAISMLGLQTLIMCRALALTSRTGILEIGPYIGGSTLAFGMGLQETGRGQIVSVDLGGSHPHSSLPTQDVHADWERNIAAHGLASRATLVRGLSYDPRVIEEVTRLANGRKFDVFLLDADGEVDAALKAYKHLLTDDCMLVVDDYYNVRGVAEDKMDICTAQLHELMRTGAVKQYVLVPWGTWFGRLNR